MSTSLADQLRRLATPQTTQLVDSKKRASILFDAAEAANKDRETIYDIGLSGLHALAAINPAFLQFEHTLFDRSAKDLVRSVESSEANRNLDNTIRRFFVHLSPHVQLHPAHLCLEWLIRRFAVHEHNQDDFLLLLLPYHETSIFVRCVQIVPLRDPKHRFHWLHVLQKPGVPLAKRVLFNRCATDGHLLRLICRHVLDAVDELDARAHTLQTLFAFYCTTVLGALEASDHVGEKFIASVQHALLKGLGSAIVDLCAASMMIAGYLFTRTQLSAPVLDGVLQRLTRIAHPGLQPDAVLLMVLCFQHQTGQLAEVRPDVLQAIVAHRWIVGALSAGACAANVHILPFFVPLMSAALRTVQQKSAGWRDCKTFCESVLVEVQFAGRDIEAAIRCILDAYVLREKPDPDVIVIESDNDEDDGIQLSDGNKDINSWYTELLKLLDRQYPEQFERVTKEIMQCSPGAADETDDTDTDSSGSQPNQQPAISGSKRKSLQTVLGFLFTAACADDGSNIFENLYHHCTDNRVAAMRYLVKNYDSLCFSDDSKKLLRNSIAERLADDSPLVVLEVLRLDVAELVQLLDAVQLVDKLRAILTRSLGDTRWNRVARAAITLITDAQLATAANADIVFMSLWPYLWPACDSDRPLFDLVVSSPFARHVPVFSQWAAASAADGKYSEKSLQRGLQSDQWPGLERLLPTIRRTVLQKAAKKGVVRKAFYALLLLAQVPQNCSAQLAIEIVDTVAAVTARLQPSLVTLAATVADDIRSVIGHMLAKNEVPTAIVARFLHAVATQTVLQPIATYDITDPTSGAELQFRLRTFSFALDRLSGSKRDVATYAPVLSAFLRRALPTTTDVIEFFSHFFVAHRLESAPVAPAIQVQAIRILELKLAACDGLAAALSLPALIKILTGLSSPLAAVRECTLHCLDRLTERADELPSNVRLLVRKVLAHREELLLDETQLLLVLFRVFTRNKELKRMLGDIFAIVTGPQGVSPLLHAIVLDIFKHINDEEWLRRIASSSLVVLQRAQADWADRHAAGSSLCVLDAFQSDIVRSTLFRLNADTIDVVRSADTDAWRFVLLALRCHHLVLAPRAGIAAATSAAIVAMEVFDADTFAKLTAAAQTELVRTVLAVSCGSADTEVLLAIGKLMRRIPLDAALHAGVFEAMVRVEPSAATAATGKKRKQPAGAAAGPLCGTEILGTVEWRSCNAFMEYLQNKRELSNAHTILPGLFGVLRRCLQFEDQSLVVYTKQLALACLLLCCRLISPDGRPNRQRIPDKVFEIDLVVQCIRGTQNPQTHHHALQLLAYTASMIPELVLHNMMDIFTFVGTSVVRRDDAYTYQIISNIIQSIIPTLIASKRSGGGTAAAVGAANEADAEQAAVVPILRVFADIILDVPEHRRLRLYADLLSTLGAARYASVFLALLFVSHVQRFPKAGAANSAAAEIAQSKLIDIAVEICNYFDCATELGTCTQLIELLHDQPSAVPTSAEAAAQTGPATGEGQIFALHNYNDYQLRHFKYLTLQFIIQLTERSSTFVQKMAHLTAAETVELKPQFKSVIVKQLQFIGQMHRLTQGDSEKIWKILLANCYDILDQVLALIYPDMLLQVVTGLLSSNNIAEVRRKALELLNKKLQQADFFATSSEETFLRLLDPLSNIIESITDRTKLIKNSTNVENLSLQQQALIAIKILSVHMAQAHAPAFRQLLDTLAGIVKAADAIPINVLAQTVLCLAELCANLRAHAISHLSKFMPSIDKILQAQTLKLAAATSGPNIIMYLLSALHKIIEALPLFLSPYLVSLMISMSTIWALLLQQQTPTGTHTTDTQRKLAKLQQIWSQLAGKLTLRTLVPMVDQCYRRIVDAEQQLQQQPSESSSATAVVSAVQPIMQLLADSLQPLAKDEINAHQMELGAFFLYALQLRSTTSAAATHSPAQIDAQEDHVIGAFVGLVLKLSETSFRPLYQRIYNWAVRDASASVASTITFYRLSARVAQALKSLFVLFSADFIANAAELLANDGDQAPPPPQLIEAIVRTLHSICLHDSQGFVNTHRFEVLLQPLVDQLQSAAVLASPALQAEVVQLLAQFGVACNDDSAWKQLNYQILLKTRHQLAAVRLLAVGACVELAKRLGEDYTPLLPETVPFLAEMLEDEDEVVERTCQARVQELERVLGEPLQKYF